MMKCAELRTAVLSVPRWVSDAGQRGLCCSDGVAAGQLELCGFERLDSGAANERPREAEVGAVAENPTSCCT